MIRKLLGKWHGVLMVGGGAVERIGHPLLLGTAKMIDQEVAGDRRNPGHEGASVGIVATQSPVHFDEHLLGQILRVSTRSSEPVADVVYAPVVTLDDFLPGSDVARNAATDQQCCHLGIFQAALPGNDGGRDCSSPLPVHPLSARKVRASSALP